MTVMDSSYTAPSPQVKPILVAIAIAIAGPFLWVGLYVGLDNGWIAAPLIGLLIGIGMRLTMKHGDRRLQITATVLTVLSCVAGYLWTDMFVIQWTFNGEPVQPTVFDALKRMLNDFTAILLIALGGYIAWVMALLPRSGDTSVQHG